VPGTGAEPVDDLERRRHQRIVELQGSRNPFVDLA
jgi:endonuclease I